MLLLLLMMQLLLLLLLLECIVGESLEVQVVCGGQGLEGEGVDLVGIAGYEVGLVEGDGEGRVGVLAAVEAAVRLLLRLTRPALLQRLRRWVGVLSK